MQPLLAVLQAFVTLAGPTSTLPFYGPTTTPYRSFVDREPLPAEDEVLGVTDTHAFRLAVGDHAAELAVRAASVLQDDVMDDLGAPWPEVRTRARHQSCSNRWWARRRRRVEG
jgi:hypothetical protein